MIGTQHSSTFGRLKQINQFHPKMGVFLTISFIQGQHVWELDPVGIQADAEKGLCRQEPILSPLPPIPWQQVQEPTLNSLSTPDYLL